MTDEIRFYKSTGEYGYLSNLYPCEVVSRGRTFPSAEHAYQFYKFADPVVADWAMKAPAPRFIAILAHGLFPYDVTPGWTEKKVGVMREVLLFKFAQHPDLEEKLLATGNRQIIEDSKTDRFWGLGKKGDGQNMLGKLLMEIREDERKLRELEGDRRQ